MKIDSVIFDLDNTLVRCSEYYLDVKHRFADMASKETGIIQAAALEILDSIDLQNLKMKGVVRSRYPQSFAAASAAIDVMMGLEISQSRMKKAWRIGDSVFRAPYTIYPGVYSALEEIRDMGIKMFVCTKGDSRVQLRKIKKNKLDKLFSPGHIYIDTTKTAEHFRNIMAEHRLSSLSTMEVGDSLKDDVGTAKEVCLVSVHVTGQQLKWAYEDEIHVPAEQISSVVELPALIRSKYS